MNNLAKKFGKKVRNIRLAKKISQGDVARRLNLHRSYISSIERGERNPSLGVVEKIAKSLNVSAADLLK